MLTSKNIQPTNPKDEATVLDGKGNHITPELSRLKEDEKHLRDEVQTKQKAEDEAVEARSRPAILVNPEDPDGPLLSPDDPRVKAQQAALQDDEDTKVCITIPDKD